jgi:retinol-binding protein 3
MVDLAIIQKDFQVLFPFAGAIHPVTKSNWEGTGVEPHIPVPQEQALQTAHRHALQLLLDLSKDEQQKKDLEWGFDIACNSYAPITVDDTSLARLAGQYGQRSFTVMDGSLAYATPQATVFKLIPMSATRFRLNEDIKFEFILDMQDKVVAVIMSYRDDRPEIRIERIKEK